MSDHSLLKLKRLTHDHVMLPFDCGDADLNEFCLKDSYDYLRRLMAVTYYVENETDTILFFSLSNDKISAVESNPATWRRVKRLFPHEKHRKDYPAVKIGRLAVNSAYRNNNEHYGTMVLDFIKEWMVTQNKTGCCFITVDAYQAAVGFYQKNGFEFLSQEEEHRYLHDSKLSDRQDTYAMYYNLTRIVSPVHIPTQS